MNFLDAFIYSVKETPEFYQQLERLYGEKTISLLKGRSPIEKMVDEATGHQDAIYSKMMGQFKRFVWDTLPKECFVPMDDDQIESLLAE